MGYEAAISANNQGVQPTNEANVQMPGNEAPLKPQQEHVIPPHERQASLDRLAKFAQNVGLGTSNPEALQNYATYLKEGGIPVDQIQVILESNGIPVQRKDKEDQLRAELVQTQTELQPFMQKLMQVYPDQPGGIGRLGQEIPITQDDLDHLQRAIDMGTQILDQKPGMAKLNAFIARMMPDKGFQSAYYFQQLIQEDPAINEPLYEHKPEGHRIRLPSRMFTYWKAQRSLTTSASIVGLTQGSGPYTGRSSQGLRKALQFGFQTALS
jgi:hypothetical protein